VKRKQKETNKENKSVEGKKWTRGRMTKKGRKKGIRKCTVPSNTEGMNEMPHEFMTCDFPVLKQAPSHKGVPAGDGGHLKQNKR